VSASNSSSEAEKQKMAGSIFGTTPRPRLLCRDVDREGTWLASGMEDVERGCMRRFAKIAPSAQPPRPRRRVRPAIGKEGHQTGKVYS
jgi:hypothetical protein